MLTLGARGLVVVAVVVVATFFGTRWAGRRLGVSEGLSLLVATGFSICGVSAIAAARGVSDADEEEVTYAIALVTLCGSLAILLLPAMPRDPRSQRTRLRRLGRRERARRRAGRGDIVCSRWCGCRDGHRRQADPRAPARPAHRLDRLDGGAKLRSLADGGSFRRSYSRSSAPPRCGSADVVPSGLLPILADTKIVLLAIALFAVGARVELEAALHCWWPAACARPLVVGDRRRGRIRRRHCGVVVSRPTMRDVAGPGRRLAPDRLELHQRPLQPHVRRHARARGPRARAARLLAERGRAESAREADDDARLPRPRRGGPFPRRPDDRSDHRRHRRRHPRPRLLAPDPGGASRSRRCRQALLSVAGGARRRCPPFPLRRALGAPSNDSAGG